MKDDGNSSQKLKSNEKGANSLNEDLEWERFMLLNLLTEAVHLKPKVFGANYSGKLLDKKSKDREDSPTSEKKKSDYERGQEIVRHIYRFFGGLLAMFSSFVGYMSDNHIFSFISFCVGLYLLFPFFKRLRKDYKNDKSGKYFIFSAFVTLVISFSVKNEGVHYFLFALSGILIFIFFKKKIAQNYEKY